MTDSELRFLGEYDASKYSRPSLVVDVAILTAEEGTLRALLIRRDNHPYRGRFSLPGGFVGFDEALDSAAIRVLRDKTGLDDVYLEQLFTFGSLGRDPRTRVVSVAFTALVPPEALRGLNGGTALAALDVPWPGETGGPVHALTEQGERQELAFDHADILGMAVLRLRGKLDYTNVGFSLLPETFTLLQLRQLHETILGVPLNKDSFRRKMLATDLLAPTGERQSSVGHRPAALYRFTGATAPARGRR